MFSGYNIVVTIKTKTNIHRGIIIFHGLLWFVSLPFQLNHPRPQFVMPLYFAFVIFSTYAWRGLFTLITGFFLWHYNTYNENDSIIKTGIEARLIGAALLIIGVGGITIIMASILRSTSF